MQTETKKEFELRRAIAIARRQEDETGRRHCVQWSVPDERYEVTERMPLVGNWWDADGILH